MKRRNACYRDAEYNSTIPSDGFALNVGLEDWQVDRVHDCYNAAQSTDLPFKLFISFDMTWVPRPGFPLRIVPILTGSWTREWLGVPHAPPRTTLDAFCVTYSPSCTMGTSITGKENS